MIDFQNLSNLPEINFKSKGRPELKELAEYIDHMKGKRKIKGSSAKSDLRKQRTEAYWQNIHKKEFMQKLDEQTKQEIISKVEKGTQGN